MYRQPQRVDDRIVLFKEAIIECLMKTKPLIILTIILLVNTVPIIAAVIDGLDPTLVRDLHLIERYQADPCTKNLARLKACNLPLESDPVLKVFLHFVNQPDSKRINNLREKAVRLYEDSWIPQVGAHHTGFLLAYVKASQIKVLLKEVLVRRVTAAYRQLQPLNDNAAQETGAAEAREYDPPLTGEGVRLSVLDSGFNLEHDDLPEPFAMMDYADYPDTSEDITDYTSGHGTHVAGTAFGSGALSEGRWMGMAPDVDPIYLKIGDDSTSNASSAAVVYAIRGAVANYETDIITMSYGGWDGFNDGSSTEEQAVDWATGEGATVFMSAGNSRTGGKHYMAEVGAQDTTDLIQVIARHVSQSIFWGFYLIWYDDPDTSIHIELSARIFNGDNELIEYDEMNQVCSPRGTESREYIPVSELPEDSSSFFIQVINHSDQAQLFHLYANIGYWSFRFVGSEQRYTVGLPSTADSCISVGAYISRTEWRDYHGVLHETRDVFGQIAYFSSLGPRIDGVQKPNITAPGQKTISCRDVENYLLEGAIDNLIISNNGESGLPADYIAMMGTSMSSPTAAGTAALILQALPDPNPSRLREAIFTGARTDSLTGDVPNYTWGWGKIDVYGALSTPFEPNHGVTAPEIITLEAVYPNPFNSALFARFRTSSTGIVQFAIYDPAGRKMWTTRRYISEPGESEIIIRDSVWKAPSGSYWFVIQDRSGRAVKSIALIK